jgi:hypothetical protein
MIITGRGNIHRRLLYTDEILDYQVELENVYTTLENRYVPLFVLNGIRQIFEFKGRKEMVYYDYDFNNDNLRNTTQKLFTNVLKNSSRYRYLSRYSTIPYILNKNCIWFINKDKQIEYLLVTVVEADYFLNKFSFKTSESFDTSKVLTLVSHKLNDDDEHKHIKSKTVEYLKYMKEQLDTDIVYTNDIRRWCFNQAKYKQEFKSVDEMDELLSNTYKLIV